MRIGLDLDNTIIDYDDAFVAAAAAFGLVSAGAARGKTALRDALRAQPDGEARWTALQAYVYGPGIECARLFAGVDRFIAAAQARAIPLAIVSHKSETAAAAPDGPNLRDAARAFLAARGIALPLYFEATRADKCRRVAALELTHLVDDLIEVFADPAYPAGVARWLFAPHGAPGDVPADRVFASWDELCGALDRASADPHE